MKLKDLLQQLKKRLMLIIYGEMPVTDWEQKGSKHPTWQEAEKAGDL